MCNVRRRLKKGPLCAPRAGAGQPPAAPSAAPQLPAAGLNAPLVRRPGSALKAGAGLPGLVPPVAPAGRARLRGGPPRPRPQDVSILEEAGRLRAGGFARRAGRAGVRGGGALLLELQPGHQRGARG